MGDPILRNNHTLADIFRWTPEDGTQRNTPNSEDRNYEGWNFISGNYLFTTDTK